MKPRATQHKPRWRSRHALLAVLVAVACGQSDPRSSASVTNSTGPSATLDAGASSSVGGSTQVSAGGAVGAAGAAADECAELRLTLLQYSGCQTYTFEPPSTSILQECLIAFPEAPRPVVYPPRVFIDCVNIPRSKQANTGSLTGAAIGGGHAGAGGEFGDNWEWSAALGAPIEFVGDVCQRARQAQRIDVVFPCQAAE